MNQQLKKMNKTSLIIMILCCIFLNQNMNAQSSPIKGANTMHAYFAGRTKPLRDLKPMPGTPRARRAAKKANKPKFTPPNFINYKRSDTKLNPDALPLGDDPVRQYQMNDGVKILTEPNLLIEGIDEETGDAGVPDTNGDVGVDHYIQIVNASWFQVFAKDGTPVTEPLSANTIWSQIGQQSFSDPVIVYDDAAERWLITDLANVNVVLYGVSATSDPMGEWNLYVLNTPGIADYPKYGVWPNAYIFTINEGEGSYPVYALNRQQMLAGVPSVDVQRIEIPGLVGGFPTATPMDWNSPMAPPSDEVFVVRMNDDAWANGNDEDLIEVWTINIDWAIPANTSTTSTQIPTAAFDSNGCSVFDGSFACIPQPGTDQGIDGIMTVIMNNVCYWNYGDHESAVLTFSVDAGNDVAGVRWMELRREPGTDWSLYQEGTYAPDDDIHRFIPAIAINGKGDIGLAYSVSGTSKFPSLRFTGRQANDPLGVMTVEEYEFGVGAGVRSLDRYGDYARMSVDPLDGSFWFTSEYVKEGGSFGTKIVNFSLRRDTLDIAPISLDSPQTGSDLSNAEAVSVTIKNVGLEAATDISVGYIFEDGTAFSEAATIDTLFSDSTYTHTFASTVDMSNVGAYDFKVFTSFALDQNNLNDTIRPTLYNLPHLDVGVTNVAGLDAALCDNIVTAPVEFFNFGTDTITSLTINYQLNGAASVAVNWEGTLISGESAFIDLELNSLQNGNNTILISTSNPNNEADEIPDNDSFSKDFEVLEDGLVITLELVLDDYPEETTWELQDNAGNILYSGGNYNGQDNATITENWCLREDDCFTFVLLDSYGDGLAEGNGSYSIFDTEGNVYASIINVNFGGGELNDFCLSVPCNITADLDITNASANGASDGAILVSVTSGVSPFTYSLDGGVTTQDNSMFSDLGAGEYNVLATDANGCTFEEVVMISEPVPTHDLQQKYDISVSPNPSLNGVFRVQVKGLSNVDQTLKVQIVDALGRPVIYNALTGVDDYYEGVISLYNFPAGVYYIHFKNEAINQLVKIIRL